MDFYVSMTRNWSPYLGDRRLRELEQVLKSASKSSVFSKYYRYALRKTGASKKTRKLERRYTDIGIRKYCRKYDQLVEELVQDLTDFIYEGSWTGQALGEENKIRFHQPVPDERLAERLGGFYRSLVRCVLRKKKATHFVEDNTWNILHFDKLLRMIPEARLVHIFRDPRDVTASYMQQTWAPSDAREAARFYAAIMDRWNEAKQNLSQHSFLEVSLEKLVENPNLVLKTVADFWDLEWEENLMDIKLNKAHSGRWRRDIPLSDQSAVKEILKEHLVHYGYKE